MKRVTLEIDDKVYADLVRWLKITAMCDNGVTLADSFCAKIVSGIESGKTDIELKYKKDCDEKNSKNSNH